MTATLVPASTFSLQNAIYFATASSLAYSSSAGNFAGLLNAQIGFGGAALPFASGSNSAYLIEDNNALTLAFRGTWDAATAESDAGIILVSDPDYPGAKTKVHTGFRNALASIWQGILSAVTASRAASPNKPFFITGHSFGGALATLVSVRLSVAGIVPTAVYTFGSPRVGNVGFFDAYQCVNYRVVNRLDIVPDVPLQDIFMQLNPPSILLPFLRSVDFLANITYKHVGTLELMTSDNQLSHDEDDWSTAKAQVFNTIQSLLPLTGGKLSADWIMKNKPQCVADHSIANYITDLNALSV